MEFKFYGESYEHLTLIVEKYNKVTDVYVCEIKGDMYGDIGWVTVEREDIVIDGEELVVSKMKYVGTQNEVDRSIYCGGL